MHDFAERIAALRPNLLRYARRRLANEAWADDAVSETVLAALARPASFDGRAQLQTWLVGILKHKIADQIERQTRERPFVVAADEGPDGDEPGGPPGAADWGDPLEASSRSEFMVDFQRSLQALPPLHGRAFVLRNWLEAGTEDICRELGVNANHLGVILFRARAKLREALPHWRAAAALAS